MKIDKFPGGHFGDIITGRFGVMSRVVRDVFARDLRVNVAVILTDAALVCQYQRLQVVGRLRSVLQCLWERSQPGGPLGTL